MESLQQIVNGNRFIRHALFWACWVLGFTFIKSFGLGTGIYEAWLVYYIVTLPVFMAHTYLLVYVAAPWLLQGKKIIRFVVVFLLSMFLFSWLDLFITNKFLSRMFPEVFTSTPLYLDPSKVLVSGIGNLYVILVFAALKMIRSWFRSDHRRREIIQQGLVLERANVNATMQPQMLLHAISCIEQMQVNRPEAVPGAIAMLSELLGLLMESCRLPEIRQDEEIRNVRKLLQLYAHLEGGNPPPLTILGEDTILKHLPAFIIFTPVEVLLRNYGVRRCRELKVRMNGNDHITLVWHSERVVRPDDAASVVISEMEKLFPSRFGGRMSEEGDYAVLHVFRREMHVDNDTIEQHIKQGEHLLQS